MNRRRTVIGVVITFLYLAIVVALSWSGREEVFKLAPNEVGDFLAGIFGPLAVLWLILGYFQQGEELRLSAEALQQQAMELAESVKQQTEMARVSREQLDVQKDSLEHELVQRRIARLPQLSMSYKRMAASPSLTALVFEIENAGERADQVQLKLSSDHLILTPPSLSTLKRREPREISMKGREYQFQGRHRVTATYRDIDGNEHSSAFVVTFGVHWDEIDVRTVALG